VPHLDLMSVAASSPASISRAATSLAFIRSSTALAWTSSFAKRLRCSRSRRSRYHPRGNRPFDERFIDMSDDREHPFLFTDEAMRRLAAVARLEVVNLGEHIGSVAKSLSSANRLRRAKLEQIQRLGTSINVSHRSTPVGIRCLAQRTAARK
jgi:hypothetical protein